MRAGLVVCVGVLLCGCGGAAEEHLADQEAAAAIRDAGLTDQVSADYDCADYFEGIAVSDDCEVDVEIRTDDLDAITAYEGVIPELLDIARRHSADSEFEPEDPGVDVVYRGTRYLDVTDVADVERFDAARPPATGSSTVAFRRVDESLQGRRYVRPKDLRVRLDDTHGFVEVCGIARTLAEDYRRVSVFDGDDDGDGGRSSVESVTAPDFERFDAICGAVSQYLDETNDPGVDRVELRLAEDTLVIVIADGPTEALDKGKARLALGHLQTMISVVVI